MWYVCLVRKAVVRVSKVPTSASTVDGPTGIKILQAAEIRGYDLLSMKKTVEQYLAFWNTRSYFCQKPTHLFLRKRRRRNLGFLVLLTERRLGLLYKGGLCLDF